MKKKSPKLSKRLLLNFLNCTLAPPLPPSADQLCVCLVRSCKCLSCHSPSLVNLTDREVIEVNPDATFDPLHNVLGFWPSEPERLSFAVWGGRNVTEARPLKVAWRWRCCSLAPPNKFCLWCLCRARPVSKFCKFCQCDIDGNRFFWVFFFPLEYKIFGDEQLELKCVGWRSKLDQDVCTKKNKQTLNVVKRPYFHTVA